MAKIGFVGLDSTGRLIATHIMGRKGHPIMGYDKNAQNRDLFHENGGISVEDANIIYENCDLIILRQPDASQVTKCITDVLKTERKSLTLINLTHFVPMKLKDLKNRFKTHEITLLNAPIPDLVQGEPCSSESIGVYGEKNDFVKYKEFMSDALSDVIYLGLLEESE